MLRLKKPFGGSIFRAAMINDLRKVGKNEYTSGTIKKLVSSNTSSQGVPVVNAENSLFQTRLSP